MPGRPAGFEEVDTERPDGEAHPVLREALVSIPQSLSLLKYLFLFLILYTYLCVCGNVYTGV